VGRGEENDIACHSNDSSQEKDISALPPAVGNDGNADREYERSGIGWDRHELCANRTISHVVDDSGRKDGWAKKQIATEKGHSCQKENVRGCEPSDNLTPQ